MEWKILVTDAYESWFLGLSPVEQFTVRTVVGVLAFKGPSLQRPYSDSLSSSTVTNLKELRIQHAGRPYRIFYAFDPARAAVLLCGGRKDGKGAKRFYQRMIALAEKEYMQHLADHFPGD